MHQKKLALVNDVTGYGRCSIAVALPIVSALKVQGCILPTAILSVHTGFHDYYLDDYTDHMTPYIESWKKNGLTFDGISTGFLGSARQIDIVLDFLRDFKGPHTFAIVDPVMGDNGQLYPSYTQEMCDEMRRLLSYADVVTPNVTEACELLNLPYRSDRDLSEDDFAAMAKALAAKGPQGVILTGIHEGPYIGNFIYDQGKMSWVRAKKVGGDRSGTGDVFTAIVSASVVRGESLEQAVQKASDFICRVMAYTEELDLPPNAGLAFEEYLTTLR